MCVCVCVCVCVCAREREREGERGWGRERKKERDVTFDAPFMHQMMLMIPQHRTANATAAMHRVEEGGVQHLAIAGAASVVAIFDSAEMGRK